MNEKEKITKRFICPEKPVVKNEIPRIEDINWLLIIKIIASFSCFENGV